jgi:predicted dehydrogenase
MSTGRINRLFVAGARQAAGVEIAAVASRALSRAEQFAREHGIERAHASYEALLDDADVEAVYISLPNSMHVEWSVRALTAGKHVLCEKPFGRRAEDVAHAFDVAEQQRRLLSEAFMYRHHPQTKRLQQLVEQGAVGRLRLIRAAFSFVARDANDIRLSTTLDGGALMDVGCYCVSAARLLAGEPLRVAAEQTLGGDGVDVTFTGIMRFARDVVAHFDAGLALAERDELEVVGDEGRLFLDDPWHCRVPLIELRRADGAQRIEIERADSYGLEAEDFSAAVRGERKPLLGRADAIGQARAIEALYDAAAGAPGIKLPSANR